MAQHYFFFTFWGAAQFVSTTLGHIQGIYIKIKNVENNVYLGNHQNKIFLKHKKYCLIEIVLFKIVFCNIFYADVWLSGPLIKSYNHSSLSLQWQFIQELCFELLNIFPKYTSHLYNNNDSLVFTVLEKTERATIIQ